MTSDDHEELLAREKPDGGRLPPAEGASARSLRRHARAPTGALSGILLALDYHLDTTKEIVIVTARSREEAAPLLTELRTRFVPNRILAVVREDDRPRVRESRLPGSGAARGG